MHVSDSLTRIVSSTKIGLPDDASKEAASMVDNDRTVVIDASTAFRVDDNWTYGFPGTISMNYQFTTPYLDFICHTHILHSPIYPIKRTFQIPKGSDSIEQTHF